MVINCKGELIDLSRPKIMGILNTTPDSFYDGGKRPDDALMLQHTELMLKQGATFIDVGGYSSRPEAEEVSEDEELSRVEPVVQLLLREFPEINISIDTFRSRVARHCLEVGASVINDISAGDLDPEMMKTVAEFQVPYIMMHMKGTPQNMNKNTEYVDLIADIRLAFSEKIARARQLKINDIIIDPGFGFSKTRHQNFELLRQLDLFQVFELPVLVGLSRKSMIYKTLNTEAENALNGTTALHMAALMKGAGILRVHDVAEAEECVQLFEEIKGS